MAVRNLSEITRRLILAQIKSKLPQALADVRTQRADPTVSTEPPQSDAYYDCDPSTDFRAPAIFAIVERIDFRKRDRGANHVNCSVDMHINVVVEDRTRTLCVKKAERYQAALHNILDQTRIEDPSDNVLLTIIVNEALFSPEYSPGAGTNAPQGMFRKEVALICGVEHYESF